MFIDRAGAKVGLIEQHSRNSKASLSFVAEQVRPRSALVLCHAVCLSAGAQAALAPLAPGGTVAQPEGVVAPVVLYCGPQLTGVIAGAGDGAG